jgi:hypothetical protein
MQFPCINLNGTDGGTLADEYMAGIVACDKAIKAVQAITVHGRDYHVFRSGDATSVAQREHAARLARLLTVRDELTAIALNIAEQNDERTKRS